MGSCAHFGVRVPFDPSVRVHGDCTYVDLEFEPEFAALRPDMPVTVFADDTKIEADATVVSVDADFVVLRVDWVNMRSLRTQKLQFQQMTGPRTGFTGLVERSPGLDASAATSHLGNAVSKVESGREYTIAACL